MFVIMMWLFVRLLYELCFVEKICFLEVIIVDDGMIMTLLLIMTC